MCTHGNCRMMTAVPFFFLVDWNTCEDCSALAPRRGSGAERCFHSIIKTSAVSRALLMGGGGARENVMSRK